MEGDDINKAFIFVCYPRSSDLNNGEWGFLKLKLITLNLSFSFFKEFTWTKFDVRPWDYLLGKSRFATIKFPTLEIDGRSRTTFRKLIRGGIFWKNNSSKGLGGQNYIYKAKPMGRINLLLRLSGQRRLKRQNTQLSRMWPVSD